MLDSANITLAGDWAKPVNTLIEKISDATGTLLAPWQIKRVATANANANKTKALADIEITELQQRAMFRVLQEETKRQENIESISKKSFEDIKEEATPEDIDSDWLSNFFDKCKNISDDEMQEQWSRILSSEANQPGKFSKKTIEVMYQLDRNDAELFKNLCTFCWFNNGSPLVLINEYNNDIFKNQNINFTTLSHLQDLGLINFQSVSKFNLTFSVNQIILGYFEKYHVLNFKDGDKNQLVTGVVNFTKAGEQLFKISSPTYNSEYYDYILEEWNKVGYEITILPTQ